MVATPAALAAAAEALRRASGPVAVDAERASGYRYGQRAYLVQLRRSGAGTTLIDPIACPDLRRVNDGICQAEWVLHAANQDLPCLAEVGLRPTALFDTELAGRLAGYPRVGLGAMVETVLGLRLEKGHSAADWSRRPLPEPWLRYAALDVEVLIELRDALEAELATQGKLDWAREEFAAVATNPPTAPRAEPWRRTSGIHRLRSRRQLAAVRALWETRDDIARSRDIAPGRILPDAALMSAVLASPRSAAALGGLPAFTGRATRRYRGRWFAALQSAAAIADGDLPAAAAGGDGPPPAHRWADRDAAAARRLTAGRAAVAGVAGPLGIPVENVLSPDAVRRLAWHPPTPLDANTVADALRDRGARGWQVSLTSAALAEALAEALADPAEVPT